MVYKWVRVSSLLQIFPVKNWVSPPLQGERTVSGFGLTVFAPYRVERIPAHKGNKDNKWVSLYLFYYWDLRALFFSSCKIQHSFYNKLHNPDWHLHGYKEKKFTSATMFLQHCFLLKRLFINMIFDHIFHSFLPCLCINLGQAEEPCSRLNKYKNVSTADNRNNN